MRLALGDLGGAHGTDERVGVESYASAIRILAGILRQGTG